MRLLWSCWAGDGRGAGRGPAELHALQRGDQQLRALRLLGAQRLGSLCPGPRRLRHAPQGTGQQGGRLEIKIFSEGIPLVYLPSLHSPSWPSHPSHPHCFGLSTGLQGCQMDVVCRFSLCIFYCKLRIRNFPKLYSCWRFYINGVKMFVKKPAKWNVVF